MSEPDFEIIMTAMTARFEESECLNYKTNCIAYHKMRKLKINAARRPSTSEMNECLRINLDMHYGTQPYAAT